MDVETQGTTCTHQLSLISFCPYANNEHYTFEHFEIISVTSWKVQRLQDKVRKEPVETHRTYRETSFVSQSDFWHYILISSTSIVKTDPGTGNMANPRQSWVSRCPSPVTWTLIWVCCRDADRKSLWDEQTMWQQQQMQLTSQMIQQHEQMIQQHDHHTRFAQLASLHSPHFLNYSKLCLETENERIWLVRVVIKETVLGCKARMKTTRHARMIPSSSSNAGTAVRGFQSHLTTTTTTSSITWVTYRFLLHYICFYASTHTHAQHTHTRRAPISFSLTAWALSKALVCLW